MDMDCNVLIEPTNKKPSTYTFPIYMSMYHIRMLRSLRPSGADMRQ